MYNALGAGAYICGEETALMESLEGKKGQPRFKPPFPAGFGLYGKPTTINNTETYASVPAILAQRRRRGSSSLGKPNNGGPKIFSVSGHVNKPGNYEISARHAVRGPARDGRRRAQRSQAEGRDPGRIIDAGVASRHDDEPCTMDYDSLQKAGSGLGSGARHRHGRDHLHGARLPAHRALLLRRIAAASARRAAKAPAGCTACSRASSKATRRWTTSKCSRQAAGQIEGHTICAFGEAAAWPVQGFLRHFWHEFEYFDRATSASIVDGRAAGRSAA